MIIILEHGEDFRQFAVEAERAALVVHTLGHVIKHRHGLTDQGIDSRIVKAIKELLQAAGYRNDLYASNGG
jgi:hypothetical protein